MLIDRHHSGAKQELVFTSTKDSHLYDPGHILHTKGFPPGVEDFSKRSILIKKMVGGSDCELFQEVHVSWDDFHSRTLPQLSDHGNEPIVHTKIIHMMTSDTVSERWVGANGTVIKSVEPSLCINGTEILLDETQPTIPVLDPVITYSCSEEGGTAISARISPCNRGSSHLKWYEREPPETQAAISDRRNDLRLNVIQNQDYHNDLSDFSNAVSSAISISDV